MLTQIINIKASPKLIIPLITHIRNLSINIEPLTDSIELQLQLELELTTIAITITRTRTIKHKLNNRIRIGIGIGIKPLTFINKIKRKLR